MSVPRSCLSVPGSSEKMLVKAAGLGADEIVIDLEDSVAAGAKAQARSGEFSWKQSADAMRTVLESVHAGRMVSGVV